MCRGERVQKQRYKEREKIVSRTDDLRQGGATDRTGGSGGGAPFIKWPKDSDYAWVEGKLQKIWTGKFGDSATIEVTATSEGLVAKGRDEDGEEITSKPKSGDVVNVGLNSSSLQDTLSQDDVGEAVHIAFEGWQESKGGNSYRLFTVLVMAERKAASVEEETVGATTGASGPGTPDNDDLPF